MITTDPAAVVTRYIYAVRDGDSGAIRDSFAEDAIWEYPGDLPLSGPGAAATPSSTTSSAAWARRSSPAPR
jgi:hypothetical protein